MIKKFEEFDWKFNFGKKLMGNRKESDQFDSTNLNNFITNLDLYDVKIKYNSFKDMVSLIYLKLKTNPITHEHEYMLIGLYINHDVIVHTGLVYEIINDNKPIEKQGDHYKIKDPPYIGVIPFGEIQKLNDIYIIENVANELNDFLLKYDKNNIFIKKIENY